MPEAEPLVAFTCNICGAGNREPEPRFDREVGSCAGCRSTVRTRAVVQMISRELFGLDIPLTQFPVVKGVRGIGISDSPDYAERLAEKFSYRNTFYHKEPAFDIVNVPESEWGSYDFLISSEVFEHIAPPVEIAFRNAFRLLKPHGLFFFTVPYTLEEATTEHFPDLHDYGIARLNGGHVLVNRTRDGRLEVFDNLVFHGGGGETLEIRRFTENDLRRHFRDAGFRELEIYGRAYPRFGILRTENWSLPMTARKDPFAFRTPMVADMLEPMLSRLELALREKEWMEWAKSKLTEQERELKDRTEWALTMERQLKERTDWALILEKDVAHHLELAERFQAEAREKGEWAQSLQNENDNLQRRLSKLNSTPWTRAGRVMRLVKE